MKIISYKMSVTSANININVELMYILDLTVWFNFHLKCYIFAVKLRIF